MNVLQIHPLDNVAVALAPIEAGALLPAGIVAVESAAQGHKIALQNIPVGADIVKYGATIGRATRDIPAGTWVHTHNMQTNLSEHAEYRYEPVSCTLPAAEPLEFQGYLRPDGRGATRNELWILPLVGCVNAVAEQLARENAHLATGNIDGVYAFPHPYGCSQMGEDHARTRKLLAALARHPNAGGVLVLGLGCENLTLEQFQAELGESDSPKFRFLLCQQVEDEFAAGSALLTELADYAGQFARQTLPAAKLVVGMKCGGSDGLSGVTANPAVGVFSDLLVAQGGTSILTEVPEMFGAEGMLLGRCVSRAVFQKAVQMVEEFKDYFVRHGQVVYENPSPGNKAGGISTLEDKSCGCVQKGGRAPIADVIDYGDSVAVPGLSLLCGPGNDLVSATALTAAGAHVILFTTGRGTPFGAPAPTVKIATNTPLFEGKGNWMDFNAGTITAGEPVAAAGARLLDYVLSVASGTETRAEARGAREIAIWRGGVTL